MLDKKLLALLVCPVSKASLDYDEQQQELVCLASGLAYPVRDGIPVMLESEALLLLPCSQMITFVIAEPASHVPGLLKLLFDLLT